MYDDLANHYRSWGLNVAEEPGWQTRGHGTVRPRVFVAHHDAISTRWSAPGPRIFRDGRPDLPGPITNVTLDHRGTVGMIAAGLAYHAGTGSWNGVRGGNSVTWGCEAQNSGTGQVWPAAQIDAYATLAAASADYFGFDSSMCCRHAEWAGSRKIDAWGPWADSPYRWENNADRFRMLVANASPDSGPMPDFTPILGGQSMLIYGTNSKGRKVNVILFPSGGYAAVSDAGAAQWVGPTLGTAERRVGKGTTNQAINASTPWYKRLRAS